MKDGPSTLQPSSIHGMLLLLLLPLLLLLLLLLLYLHDLWEVFVGGEPSAIWLITEIMVRGTILKLLGVFEDHIDL